MATKTPEEKNTTSWPELAIGLYDKLTGRGAMIEYDFENMEVHVPSKAGGGEAEYAKWKLNGKLRVRTSDSVNQNGAA
ncbi:MAG: hypothetical protein WBA12_07140 [Catalinimonas sp.]